MGLFKRQPEARKVEAKKAQKVFNSNDIQGVANKLGISSAGNNIDKVKFELNKIRHKPNLLKELKITEADLKKYGY
jgi:hypothetical protein